MPRQSAHAGEHPRHGGRHQHPDRCRRDQAGSTQGSTLTVKSANRSVAQSRQRRHRSDLPGPASSSGSRHRSTTRHSARPHSTGRSNSVHASPAHPPPATARGRHRAGGPVHRSSRPWHSTRRRPRRPRPHLRTDRSPALPGPPRPPRARPRIRAVHARQLISHRHHFGAQRTKTPHLPVDLGDVTAQQPLGRLARALPGVAHLQQRLDLGPPQPEPLRALDEQQPIDRGLVIGPVVRCGARSGPAAAPPSRNSGSCPDRHRPAWPAPTRSTARSSPSARCSHRDAKPWNPHQGQQRQPSHRMSAR